MNRLSLTLLSMILAGCGLSREPEATAAASATRYATETVGATSSWNLIASHVDPQMHVATRTSAAVDDANRVDAGNGTLAPERPCDPPGFLRTAPCAGQPERHRRRRRAQ